MAEDVPAGKPEGNEGILIKLLRDATPFEIGLVAFLFLPPVVLAWIPILKEVLPAGYDRLKIGIYVAVISIYVVLVGIMVLGKVRAEKQKTADKLAQQGEIERIRERIRGTLSEPNPVWRNLYWIQLESGVKESEVEKHLGEMMLGGEIDRGVNPEHPEWGFIYALRSRKG